MNYGLIAKVTSVVALGTSMTAGIGYKYNQVKAKRAALDVECAKLYDEMREIEAATQERAAMLKAKIEETKDLMETVDTLWVDRIVRYKKTNWEMYSYIKAMPEAFRALRGLTVHYQEMVQEMRKFVTFDIASSKVHHLGLLLAHAEVVGVEKVSRTLSTLFAAEPLVVEVCDSVLRDVNSSDAPKSSTDVSLSFVFCMAELDRTAKEATERFLERATVREKAPSLLVEAEQKALDAAKVSLLSAGEVALARKKAELANLLVRDQRQLRTTDDVLSAIQHVDAVAELLRRRVDGAEDAPRTAVESSREGGGPRHANVGAWLWLKVYGSCPTPTAVGSSDSKDALLEYLRSDREVMGACEQLQRWRDWAAIYVMRNQAKDALDAYHHLLSETLMQVNDVQD